MSGYITQWNSLETVGQKGKGMGGQRHDHTHNAGRFALRYASIAGAALSIISLAMVMM